MVALLTILLAVIAIYGLFHGATFLKKKKEVNENWYDEFVGESADSPQADSLPWVYDDPRYDFDASDDVDYSADEAPAEVAVKPKKKVAKKKTAVKKKPVKKSSRK